MCVCARKTKEQESNKKNERKMLRRKNSLQIEWYSSGIIIATTVLFLFKCASSHSLHTAHGHLCRILPSFSHSPWKNVWKLNCISIKVSNEPDNNNSTHTKNPEHFQAKWNWRRGRENNNYMHKYTSENKSTAHIGFSCDYLFFRSFATSHKVRGKN